MIEINTTAKAVGALTGASITVWLISDPMSKYLILAGLIISIASYYDYWSHNREGKTIHQNISVGIKQVIMGTIAMPSVFLITKEYGNINIEVVEVAISAFITWYVMDFLQIGLKKIKDRLKGDVSDR